MTTPILSPEEINALRQEIGVGDASAATPEESVDLLQGEQRVLRKHIPLFERRLEYFAATAQTALSRALHMLVRCGATPIDAIGPQMAEAALNDLAVVAEMRSSIGLLGFIGMDIQLGFQLIERAFGAPADPPLGLPQNFWSQPTRTKLTELEKRTVHGVLTRLCEDLNDVLLVRTNDRIDLAATSGTWAPEIPQDVDNLILWRLNVRLAQGTGSLLLLFLPRPLETLSSSTEDRHDPDLILRHIEECGIQVSANLGSTFLAMRELSDLRPGDVLFLDRGQGEDVPVLVNGLPKFLGKPLVHRDSFAMQISARIPHE